jgi:hypothetical protein
VIYSPVPMMDVTTEWVHFEIGQRSTASFTENRLIEQARFYFYSEARFFGTRRPKRPAGFSLG